MGEIVEGLTIWLENEYIGPCPDEIFDFPDLSALGVGEVKEGRQKPSASVFYIDPAGVKWSSPDAASADNVLVPTKRT